MKISVLATGSKGNSTYISTNEHQILVDVGLSPLYISKKLSELGTSPKEIDCIFLTHTHSDHINGLRNFIKKYNPTIFLTSTMYEDIRTEIPLSNYFILEEDIVIDDLIVHIFKTSHDASDSNGYVFESNNKKIAYVTDTGYINRKNHHLLENCEVYVMESNHDTEILMNGKYPYYLKQRILSDKGHLSNKDSANYLSNFAGENTKGVILIHLSEENNDPDIALETLNKALTKKNKQLQTIIISNQKDKTELIEL